MMRLLPLSLVAALSVAAPFAPAQAETAVFAGGCFWCVESDLEKLPGVRDVVSGYAGGKTQNPTYKNYERGGHREVVQVDFDETKISYGDLVGIFLRTVDVTDAGGQFCDRGFGYSTAIHPLDEKQAEAAKAEIDKANKSLGGKVVTPVEGAAVFWPAEDYHQAYYKSDVRTLTRFGYVTRAEAYKGYRKACGRDARVKSVWGGEAYKGLPKAGS
ncbi:peptide-methionine (S)-S-oxide reductase [Labrenzia sp. EL_208]|uniref:Peptide methionine sulfoxide reductase MsrA n=1 Tax=Roseibium album TaxID=311410 RepID=A0A0M7AV84_9HYPH|nr:peptide-methionine (S)-S-oxide reductase [Labrenzia sp. EL_162]MBG6175057.1 peptide-methionine (S)-S-oxide reductase [Labrenzia sp. EL_132]MBG6193682.1 peptide-methionine (S)-S-oxide reductase [Labrenzia sp. EL_159]MBG6200064.1 peptide-methionine (S)-S-oxide reductase [Labrenzia sp. EL_13]MBG6207368.1 peptide-methionine (S)-S-oxide reductase [Labrenzia sp. EL_126]MBG6229669.1 peptide-methionine (S)-S-oxide reductase [Labrenzia sp. EL_208]MCR9060569.1 peptide-methionine (S)-S-oxide reductas